MSEGFDIVVVGGGMAGMSIGAVLADHARVLVLEAEDAPGYHATGRSVAFWSETYGGPAVQPLTSASGPMLAHPDPAFSETPFLSPRGAVHIGPPSAGGEADAFVGLFAGQGVDVRRVGRDRLEQVVPGLLPDWTTGVAEPTCQDIDASGLLAAYRRQLLQRGGVLRCGDAFRGARRDGAGWRVETAGGPLTCTVLVNAGGAWADEVARLSGVMSIGITPLRRTVVQLRTDPPVPADLPLVLDLAQSFYFKSVGGGRLWLTPHDEQPQGPGDAAPDEMAVATAIDRFQKVVGWRIAGVERKWAGLRSFAPDRAPVYGFDVQMPGFFWFAGQGGFGIQTAPAAALLGGALLTGGAPDEQVAHLDAGPYSPARFSALPG
ncbi:MAG TPA: FAD-dependent oxidoreductase [Sphingobium sp.]|uniref:NAD(P)/FAD-dependent oxidoreductase n=1 Tax=Sphingobium sp. TaxID=1912891 RepID=UPI002ED570C1